MPEPPDTTYPASATLLWDVSWSATDQPGGSLGTNATTTAFDLTVTDAKPSSATTPASKTATSAEGRTHRDRPRGRVDEHHARGLCRRDRSLDRLGLRVTSGCW